MYGAVESQNQRRGQSPGLIGSFTDMAFGITMQSEWRLTIVGDGHRGRFYRERWQLLNPARLKDDSPAQVALITTPVTERGRFIADLLKAGHAVIVEPPLAPTIQEARALLALADSHQLALQVISLRRTESDYLAACAALATGRIGSPVAIRWQAAEYAVWADAAANDYRRGETFSITGPPLFDQLAGLVTAAPRTVQARNYPAEDGFAVELSFEDGCQARLEVRRMARAALRTGWMIEGTTGAYHHRKLFTTTADGELVDETVPFEPPALDPIQELEAMTTIAPMAPAEQERCLWSVRLYEAAMQSLQSGEPVDWNSL